MIKVDELDVEISGGLEEILKEIDVLFQALSKATKNFEGRGLIFAMLLIALNKSFKEKDKEDHGSNLSA